MNIFTLYLDLNGWSLFGSLDALKKTRLSHFLASSPPLQLTPISNLSENLTELDLLLIS